MTDARPLYEPPTGDEPLDAIEQAWVRMWVRIVVAELRKELAAQQPDAVTATDTPAAGK